MIPRPATRRVTRRRPVGRRQDGTARRPIVLFTDYGVQGPYLGQVRTVLLRAAPDSAIIDLMHDAPAFDPRAASYLLAALAPDLPAEAVVLGVVDPGVGGRRRAVILEAGGRHYVGPDNGLFALVARRAEDHVAWSEITWKPQRLSATFHGRDLFAPVAAALARGDQPPDCRLLARAPRQPDWPDDWPAIIYIDGFGNAMTGIRAGSLRRGMGLAVEGRFLARGRTFSDVPVGTPFWYENSSGLAEIAVNRGRAADLLGLKPGSPVSVVQL